MPPSWRQATPRPVSGCTWLTQSTTPAASFLQCAVAVLPGDSLGTLRSRVQAREKEFVVEGLGQTARGEVKPGDRVSR